MDRQPVEDGRKEPPAKKAIVSALQGEDPHGRDGPNQISGIQTAHAVYPNDVQHPASNVYPYSLPGPDSSLIPDILIGSLAYNSQLLASRIPLAAAAAAAAPTFAQTYHPATVAAAAAAAAREAIVSLRLRHELNQVLQDPRALPLMNWDNTDIESHGRNERARLGYVGGFPVAAHVGGSAVLPPRALLSAGYYPSAVSANFGPLLMPPALLVSDWIRRQEVEALLWQGPFGASAGVPQHAVVDLRPDPPGIDLHRSAPDTMLHGAASAFAAWDNGTTAAATSAAPLATPVAVTLTAMPYAAAMHRSRSEFEVGRGSTSSSTSLSSSSLCVATVTCQQPHETSVRNTRKRTRFRMASGAAAATTISGRPGAAPCAAPGPCRVLPMSHGCDATYCTSYQCLLREQIEYFEADDCALRAKAQGRNVPIQLRQVGIRCVHCARSPAPRNEADSGRDRSGRMVRGAVYYPARLASLYQAVQNMARNHFVNRTCPSAPPSLIDEIVTARSTRPERSGGQGKRYFGQAAEGVGIADASEGSGLVLSRKVTAAMSC
jgi:hypothetical protein